MRSPPLTRAQPVQTDFFDQGNSGPSECRAGPHGGAGPGHAGPFEASLFVHRHAPGNAGPCGISLHPAHKPCRSRSPASPRSQHPGRCVPLAASYSGRWAPGLAALMKLVLRASQTDRPPEAPFRSWPQWRNHKREEPIRFLPCPRNRRGAGARRSPGVNTSTPRPGPSAGRRHATCCPVPAALATAIPFSTHIPVFIKEHLRQTKRKEKEREDNT